MNKLEKVTGKKIPFVWDDLEFVQSSYKEALSGLISAFGVNASDGFRITGCVVSVSNGTYSVTSGYIAFMGEVFKVDTHSVTPPLGNSVFWGVDESWEASGYKEDSEGGHHNTYKLRRAKLTTGVLPADYLAPGCDYFQDKIINLAKRDLAAKIENTPWINPIYHNGWTGSEDIVTGIYARYRKDQFGYLEISGNVIPTNANSDVIFTLPAGYRPSSQNYRIRTVINDRNGVVKPLEIDENGQVKIVGYDPSTAAYQFNLRIKLW